MDSLDRFRGLLRIQTISSLGPLNGSYADAVELLSSWMSEIGMTDIHITEFHSKKPVLVGSWVGSEPSLSAVLLNGHYDVVPVDESGWCVPPFAAEARNDAKIICRGTQDMKSVVVQYLEALRQLKESGWRPRRTIHVSLVPDEEVGGHHGAALFVQSGVFKKLNIGIALDEGLANPKNKFSLFYGERASNWVILRTRGPAGHGSRFVKDTAIEKMVRILGRIYSTRSEGQHKCHHENVKLGDLLSMNVTAMRAGVPSSVLKGGFAVNVIPTEAEIAIDIRVPLSVTDIERVIRDEWIKDEQDVEIDYADQNDHPSPDLLAYPLESDKWVKALLDGVRDSDLGVDTCLEVFPAGTDSRYIRRAGIPCIGFSPIRNTPILLHDHNEFITEEGFLEGIKVYVQVIQSLSNV